MHSDFSIERFSKQEINLKETTVTNQSKPYEPLTADNSAQILVDHQIGLMTGVRDYETGELKEFGRHDAGAVMNGIVSASAALWKRRA